MKNVCILFVCDDVGSSVETLLNMTYIGIILLKNNLNNLEIFIC